MHLQPVMHPVCFPRNYPTIGNGNFYAGVTQYFHITFIGDKTTFFWGFYSGKPLIKFGHLFSLHKREKIAENPKCAFFLHFFRKGLLSVKRFLRIGPVVLQVVTSCISFAQPIAQTMSSS